MKAISKTYEDAKEVAANMLNIPIEELQDDKFHNSRYGNCQCKCGETILYWFHNGAEPISVGVCEDCGEN